MDLKARIVITKKDRTNGFKSTRTGLDQLNSKVDQVKNNIKNLFVAGVAIQLAKNIIGLADNMALLNDRLKQATDSEAEFNQVSQELFEISQRTGTALEGNVRLYTRIAESVKEAGGTAAEAAALVETFNKTLLLGGANTQEAASATLQFAQAMGSGILAGEEFKAINEASSKTIRLLAEGMGVAAGDMKKLASEGKLTGRAIREGFANVADKVDEDFSKLSKSVGREFQKIRNEFAKYINDTNEAGNVTQTFAEGLSVISGSFKIIADGAIAMGEVVLAVFAAKISILAKEAIASSLAAAATRSQALANVNLAASAVAAIEAEIIQIRTDISRTASITTKNGLLLQSQVLEDSLTAAKLRQSEANVALAATGKAATTSLLTMSTALNALIAGFAGWQLGTWLRENFVEAKIIGNELIGVLLSLHEVSKTVLTAGIYDLSFADKNLVARLSDIREEITDMNLAVVDGSKERKKIVTNNQDAIAAGESKLTAKAKAEAAKRVKVALDAANRKLEFEFDLQNKLRDWQRGTASAAERDNQILAEQYENRIELQKAIAEGNFKKQELIARRMMKLAEEQRGLQAEIEEELDSYLSTGEEGLEDYEHAAKALNKALEAQKFIQNESGKAVEKTTDKAQEGYKKTSEAVSQVVSEVDRLAKIKAIQTMHTVKSNVDDIIKKVLSLDNINTSSTHTIHESTVQTNRTGGVIRKFADGGFAPKSGKLPGFGGGDKIKALLEPGEFIIRKESVQKYGLAAMERINQGKEAIRRKLGGIIPRFATGGSVSNTSLVGETSTVSFDFSDKMAAFKLLIKSIDSFAAIEKEFASDVIDINAVAEKSIESLNSTLAESSQRASDQFNDSVADIQVKFTGMFDAAAESYTRAINKINANEISFNISADDAIRNIVRQGLTEEEVFVDKIKEIREKEQQARAALLRGDVEEASRLNQEVVALSQAVSQEVVDSAGNIIVSQEEAAAGAIGFIENSKLVNQQIADEKRSQADQQLQLDRGNIETEKAAALVALNVENQMALANIQAELAAELAAIEVKKLAEISAAKAVQQLAVIESDANIAQTTKVLGASMLDLARLRTRLSFGALFGEEPGVVTKYKNKGIGVGFSSGGGVGGTGDGDTVPAMLTPGEFVIKKSSVQKFGSGFMSAVNQGIMPTGFATGGEVGGASAGNAPSFNLFLNGKSGSATFNSGADDIIEELRNAGATA